jgi:putative RNA 2'-phosphotransferase
MNNKKLVSISKYLAKILRHDPKIAGLTLQDGGWVRVDQLLIRTSITLDELKKVVETNDKKRFSFSEDGTLIRANQGHSTEVKLEFKEIMPPRYLYHGTVEEFIPSIMKIGLQKMKRHHVHLSKDVATATKVGSRRGKPVILEIDAQTMAAAGYQFFISDNGVYLTDEVPAFYIRRTDGQPRTV